jgi:WD40 repeat protein
MVHPSSVNSVAFSPDGKTIVMGSDDRVARLWDGRSGEPKGVPVTRTEPVSCVAFSPVGGTMLASSGT